MESSFCIFNKRCLKWHILRQAYLKLYGFHYSLAPFGKLKNAWYPRVLARTGRRPPPHAIYTTVRSCNCCHPGRPWVAPLTCSRRFYCMHRYLKSWTLSSRIMYKLSPRCPHRRQSRPKGLPNEPHQQPKGAEGAKVRSKKEKMHPEKKQRGQNDKLPINRPSRRHVTLNHLYSLGVTTHRSSYYVWRVGLVVVKKWCLQFYIIYTCVL